jgi:hypothetical protein
MKAVHVLLLVVVGALLVGIGWHEGRSDATVTGLPQLMGYEFTGTATYTAKDPSGNAVRIHYERQPLGYVVYIVADRVQHKTLVRPDAADFAPKIDIPSDSPDKVAYNLNY